MAVALAVDKDEAKRLYSSGISPTEIGLKLGVTPNTIRIWATRGRWKAKAEAKPKTDDLTIQGLGEEYSKRSLGIATRIITRLEELTFKGIRDTKDAAAALSSVYSTARKALGLDDNQVQRHVHVHVMDSCRSTAILDAEIIPESAAIAESPVDSNPADRLLPIAKPQ